MVCAVAVEAQLKFQASGITRELGLGIGKLVFTALNRAEVFIALLLLASFFIFNASRNIHFIFSLILLILLTQTFWLLPDLVERIDLIISGQLPPSSSLHIFYVSLEAGKILLLAILSVLLNWRSAALEK